MHRVRRLIAGLLAALAVNIVSAAPAAQQEVLAFCFENENVRPWRTSGGEGLNFELLDRVAAELNLSFRYIGVPWKRCLQELKSDLHAGAIGASFRNDRLPFGAYPSTGTGKADSGRSLYIERYVVVRRRFAALTWNGKNFQHLGGPIGAPLGYSVVEDLRRAGVVVDEGAQTSRDVLRKLLLDRIEGAVLLQGEASAMLSEEPGMREQLEILPVPFAEKPYYLLLSHRLQQKHPDLAARIWAAIPRQRATLAYQESERKALAAPR